MTDRDTFAAAALTGLLVNANGDIDEDTLDTPSDLAYTAYEMANAMLRERERSEPVAYQNGIPMYRTNHDAAPAARARTDADSARTDKAAPRPSEGTDENRGNCDTCRAEVAPLRDAIRRLADQDATLSVQNGNVTVTMDATLTPEERDAVETAALEADAHQHTHRAATLRGLLERLK